VNRYHSANSFDGDFCHHKVEIEPMGKLLEKEEADEY
jgi:hypothetical protein